MHSLEGILRGLKRTLMYVIGILYLARGKEECQIIIYKKNQLLRIELERTILKIFAK